jgi:hypothetical protein
MTAFRYVIVLLIVAALAAFCAAQERAPLDSPRPIKKKEDLKFKHDQFTFVRIRHSDAAGGRQGGNWATDYPDSDKNLTARIAADTGIKTDPEGKVLGLTDAELKKYPFAYLIEPGAMRLTDAEVTGLREYLTGGGFLLVDDFWGEAEWTNFEAEFKRVFPDRPLKELPLDHPIFHCFYDITAKPQVPSIHAFLRGQTAERFDALEPHYRGLVDDKGRLMALVCHNTDLGDGWERADVDARYFREVSQRLAYPMGVNIVVYVLSAAAAEPQLDEHLAAFAPLVGKTWRGEFKSSTKEKPMFDVARWDVILKGKAIRSTHSVNDGIYGGETIIMWDRQKKTLAAFYFTTAGFFTESTFELKDGKLLSRETVRGNQQGITEVEAVSEVSDGKLHVKSRYLKNGQWIDGHEITYVEAPDAKVKLD